MTSFVQWQSLKSVVVFFIAIYADGSFAMAQSPLGGPPTAIAIFDFELIDTSLEGELKGVQARDLARLNLISDLLRRLLNESGQYKVVNLSSLTEQIKSAGYLHSCNGCEVDMARPLGVKITIIGHVQKVSTLILSLNLLVRSVETGNVLRVISVDIRGNTDASWRHGIEWLVRNRILKMQEK